MEKKYTHYSLFFSKQLTCNVNWLLDDSISSFSAYHERAPSRPHPQMKNEAAWIQWATENRVSKKRKANNKDAMSQRLQCQLSSLSRLLERANFFAALWRWQRGCNCWLNVRARPSTTFTFLSLQSEEKWACFEPFGNGGTEGCETDTVERKGYCTSVFREEPALEKNLFRGVKTESVRKGRSGPKEHCLCGDEKTCRRMSILLGFPRSWKTWKY